MCAYAKPYRRTDLFPWGRSHQKGPVYSNYVQPVACYTRQKMAYIQMDNDENDCKVFLVLYQQTHDGVGWWEPGGPSDPAGPGPHWTMLLYATVEVN